ncbi:unnamed protein product [Acidithrix sp. C25]|nr:unnamed protein product [Acidithrix sp. C25]
MGSLFLLRRYEDLLVTTNRATFWLDSKNLARRPIMLN